MFSAGDTPFKFGDPTLMRIISDLEEVKAHNENWGIFNIIQFELLENMPSYRGLTEEEVLQKPIAVVVNDLRQLRSEQLQKQAILDAERRYSERKKH